MKKLLLGGLVAMMALSCSSCRSHPDPRLPDKEITVTMMSYNVGVFQKYYSTLGHYSYPEVAGLINQTGACVVGLNETDWERPRTDQQHQAELLAAELGEKWDYQFTYALDPTYGNSILWNRDLGLKQRFPRLELTKNTGSESRSMGAVEFDEFIFCVTHLDHKSADDQLAAVATITEWARKHSHKPVFLVGDMNAVPESATIQEYLKGWKRLSPEGFTFPSGTPRKCIDYIFVYNDCATLLKTEVLEGGVITPDINPVVSQTSDHCPVWIKVKMTVKIPTR